MMIPVFDFGGTLYDLLDSCVEKASLRIQASTGIHIRRGRLRTAIAREWAFRSDPRSLEKIRALTNVHEEKEFLGEIFRGILSRLGADGSSHDINWLVEMYRDPDSYGPLPGAMNMLLAYQHEKVPMALISNSSPMTENLLNQSGLKDFFRVIVLSHRVGMVKPEAGIYRLALEELRIRPGNAAYVDDRLDFVLGAARIGMIPVHFKHHYGNLSVRTEDFHPYISPTDSMNYYTINTINQFKLITDELSYSHHLAGSLVLNCLAG